MFKIQIGHTINKKNAMDWIIQVLAYVRDSPWIFWRTFILYENAADTEDVI